MAEGGKVWCAWRRQSVRPSATFPRPGLMMVPRLEGLASTGAKGWHRDGAGTRSRDGCVTRVAESRTEFFTNHLTDLGSNAKVLVGLGKGLGERAGAGGRLPG